MGAKLVWFVKGLDYLYDSLSCLNEGDSIVYIVFTINNSLISVWGINLNP